MRQEKSRRATDLRPSRVRVTFVKLTFSIGKSAARTKGQGVSDDVVGDRLED
ncbi:MAG: hypothetical protein JRF46_16315 [Deltaproteobacteria bacterium]|nr:hypothetical protein [Deltaproteobacteria bacterium]